MDEKKTKTLGAPTSPSAKSIPERVIDALAAAGLETLDCRKMSAVDGDLYTVRILDKQ